MKMKLLLMSMLTAAVLVIAGCGEEESPPTPTEPAASAELPADLILSSSPEKAQSVKAVRDEAKDGDVVTVAGWVGGGEEPIAEQRAIFTLLDKAIPSCSSNPSDGCPTPWDACCEPADVVAANSVAVQVVSADGSPLHANLKNVTKLEPMREVVVVGKLHRSPDGAAATIDATGLYVSDSKVQ